MMFRQPSATAMRTAILVLFSWANSVVAGQRYRIEAIGPVPTTNPIQFVQSVGGLNNLGEVAFSYGRQVDITPTYSRIVDDAYVGTANGWVSIPNLGGDDAQALDITDSGLVVGGASSADTDPTGSFDSHYFEPFISQGGHTSVIPTPTRGFSLAAAANERGEVIGSSSSGGSNGTVFKWSMSGGYQDLGDFGAYIANPVDINERSDILINVTPNDVLQYGETYQYRGTKTILYNGGSIAQVPDSEFGLTFGSAINDNGVVVGQFYSIPGREGHAYIWDTTNGFRDLGQESEFSYAVDVNDAGVVIGASAPAYEQPTTPWVYTEQDGRQRLIDLIDNLNGWTWLESASRINDRGQIAGIGWGPGGFWDRHVFLLTPIPEPSTFNSSLLLWLCAMTLSRRRSRYAFDGALVEKTPIS